MERIANKMKRGTILFNTYAGENNPLGISLYIGKNSTGTKIKTLYFYNGKLKEATFFSDDLYKVIIPVGYSDIINKFAKEAQDILSRTYPIPSLPVLIED